MEKKFAISDIEDLQNILWKTLYKKNYYTKKITYTAKNKIDKHN